MRIEDIFPFEEDADAKMFADDLVAEVHENVEDLVPYLAQVAPRVYEGHEEAPLDHKVGVALLAGVYVGWKLKSELDG